MNIDLVRRIGAAILAVAVVAVWFTMKPNVSPPRNFSSELQTAVANNKSNAASDTTVYQQQVSNGWLSNDLLEILIKAEDAHSRLAAPSDRRIPAELVLLTLGVALFLGTASVTRRPTDATPATSAATGGAWPDATSGSAWGTTLTPPAPSSPAQGPRLG